MTRYSTVQVAKMLGIHQPSLQRLIRGKRIPFPPLERVGRLKIRLWTKADVERARKAMKRQ
jgi:excisionase family DNA binding protein